jgi:MarR family transcriptional regulator for hemolysin
VAERCGDNILDMGYPADVTSASPPECLATDLCWLLSRASHLLSQEFEAALHASGVSPRKHQVLSVAQNAELTQTELARIVGLDKTTMMVTLDELERDGLAERRPLPSDRRARVVAITTAGRRALRSADAALEVARERALSLLPAEQRDLFVESLGRLACSEGRVTAQPSGVAA